MEIHLRRRRRHFRKHSGLCSVLVPFQALTNANELRLYILNVDHSNLRPHGLVEEGIRLSPNPLSSRQRRASGETRGSVVALVRIGLHQFVAWQQDLVVQPERIGMSDLVVGSENLACALHVWSNCFLILLL